MEFFLATVEKDAIPDWLPIYFTKVGENDQRCNICEVSIATYDKSEELLDHIKNEHKEIFELHKENPEATVGFRIEFLHLNVLKDIEEGEKNQPVILGEMCEAETEEIIPPIPEQLPDLQEKPVDQENNEDNQILFVSKQQKTKVFKIGDSRKRSWVWKYFHRMSNIIFRCSLCNVVLSIKGCNTNNMNRHVRTRHPDIYELESSSARKRGASLDNSTDEVQFLGPTPAAVKVEEICTSDKDDDANESKESSTSRQRRSWIWSYFDNISPVSAQCKLCKRNICHGGNATGNMNRHLKMIHQKTGDDRSWVWKVFDVFDNNYFVCKICQTQCRKHSDADKSITGILTHLKVEHGVISGDQIITGTDDCDDDQN